MKTYITLLCYTLIFIPIHAEELRQIQEKKSKKNHEILTVMTFNICTMEKPSYSVYRDERHPKLHPDQRLPRISSLINHHLPDVVCFQECRRKEAYELSKQLYKNYNVIAVPLNGTPLTYYFVIAYKKSKLLPEQNSQYWLTGKGGSSQFQGNEWCSWGRLLIGVTFALLQENGLPNPTEKRIHIFNTHLGLRSEEKMAITKDLIACIQKKLGEQFDIDPLVLCGDFNSFPDVDGPEQRKIITDTGFEDPLIDLKSIDGYALSGSFVGYSTDPLYIAEEPKLLDGAFVKNAQVVGPAVALTDDIEGLEGPITNEALIANRDKLLSDHLPILVKIKLTK